jgi:hypothetical protein
MTLGRMILLSIAGMLLTGLTVYALAPSPAPPAKTPALDAEDDDEPQPTASTSATVTAAPTPPPPVVSSATAPNPRPAPTTLSADHLAALAAFAQTEAPGMSAEGPAAIDVLQQGKTMDHSFQLTPGKCYTGLAMGFGITKLEATLIILGPGGSASVVNGHSTGSKASVGGRGNCYRSSALMPVQAGLVVRAEAGRGFAVARIYAR